MLTVTVKPELLELISQYQHQVTVQSDCFQEGEMPGGGRSQSKGKGKQLPAEERVKTPSEKGSQPKPSKVMQKMKKARMGAESVQTEPAASTSSSRASSVALEKKRKLALEMEEALRATVDVLFQCKQQR